MLPSHLSGLSSQILSDTKSLLEFRGNKVLGGPSIVIVIGLLIFLNVKPESEYIGNYWLLDQVPVKYVGKVLGKDVTVLGSLLNPILQWVWSDSDGWVRYVPVKTDPEET